MPKPPDPFDKATQDVLVERILALRLTGMKPAKIAEKLTAEGHEISWTHVTRLIREAATECRANHQELLDQRFMEQDRRVEFLIAIGIRKVRRLAKARQPFEDTLRIVLQLFERQAKLHGLDTEKASKGGRPYKDNMWDSAPFEDVQAEAERIGLIKPGEFRTATGR